MVRYPAFKLMQEEQQTEREKKKKLEYKRELDGLRENYHDLAERFRALFLSTKEIDELR